MVSKHNDIKIDYIIPTYYDSAIVKVGLDALCRQTMKECLKVIVVNDCSPHTDCNYQDLIDEYKDKLDIIIVKTPYNCGPGMAMQYGVDTGTSKYYLIQDDDDCIASDDVIESYVRIIENNLDVDNIATIMGDSALCNKDYSILRRFEEKTIVHGRLFFRDFMEKYNIRYVDEVSWWMDDYYINILILLIMNEHENKYKDLYLDKLCYLYRPGLEGSVTKKMTNYEIIFRDIVLDVEVRKFMDKRYGIDKDISIYKCINKKLFDIMFELIRMQYKNDIIRKREWEILTEYREYLISIIGDTSECRYITDGNKFNNYRCYALKHSDTKEYSEFNIDLDILEDMYYTYLSSEKTMFNCSYSELTAMLKGKQ